MELNENILNCHKLLQWGYDMILGNKEHDSLEIFGALGLIGRAVDVMKEEYKKDAQELAIKELKKSDKTSGGFRYNGLIFSLSESKFFDFVNKPHKYTDEIGTAYRKEYYTQQEYETLKKACTKLMAGYKSQYELKHPNVVADDTIQKLSFEIGETGKMLGIVIPEKKKEAKVVTLNEL